MPRAHSQRLEQTRSRETVWTRMAVSVFAVALVAAPLTFGGLLGWSVPVLTGAMGVAAIVAGIAAAKSERAVPFGAVAAVFVVGLALTIAQATTLPCDWLAPFRPVDVDHARRTAALLDTAARCAWSSDAGRTREEVVKGFALLATFAATSLVSVVAQRDTVLRVLAGAALATATVALGHVVVGASAIYGVYAPLYGTASYAPFVNPNHLGGVLAMAVPVCLGLALSSRHAAWKWPWRGAAAFLLVGTVSTLSRGAILGALAGIGVFGALEFRSSVPRENPHHGLRGRLASLMLRRGTLAVAPLVLSIVVVLGFAGLDALWRELGTGDVSKLSFIASSAQLALLGPWLGVGRGAFPIAFLQHTEIAHVRAEAAESFPVQWAVEWGLPVAVVFSVVLMRAYSTAVVEARRPHLWGAVAGLFVYASQNLVDFGSEVLGSALPATALLAVCVTPHVPVELNVARIRRSSSFGLLAGVGALVAASMLGRGVAAQRIDTARLSLERSLQEGDRAAFAAQLESTMLAHPQDPIPPLLAAAEGTRHRDPRALAFAGRAMALAPSWASPHIVAATSLDGFGRHDQALLEMREALARDHDAAIPPACSMLRSSPDARSLQRLAPDGVDRSAVLSRLLECLPVEVAGGELLDLELVRDEPTLLAPRVRLIQRALSERRVADAERFSDEACRVDAEDGGVLLATARTRLAAGRFAEAEEYARTAEGRLADPWAAVTLRARAAAGGGQWDGARNAIGELRGLAGSDVRRLGEAEMLLGQIELEGGHRGRALHAFEVAWRTYEREDALVSVAELAREMGDEERAAAALATLCARGQASACGSSSEP